MTPAYFAESPAPAPTPKRSSIPRISSKTFEDYRAKHGRAPFATTTRSGKKIPKKNAKRAAKNHARAYGGEYADWIRSLPCVGCSYQGPAVEAAHTTTGGMGRKADAKTLVPLCGPHPVPYRRDKSGQVTMTILVEGCHRFAHRVGHKKLEKVYRVNLREKAAVLWAEWLAFSGEADA